jgi:hypothetical protein
MASTGLVDSSIHRAELLWAGEELLWEEGPEGD